MGAPDLRDHREGRGDVCRRDEIHVHRHDIRGRRARGFEHGDDVEECLTGLGRQVVGDDLSLAVDAVLSSDADESAGAFDDDPLTEGRVLVQ